MKTRSLLLTQGLDIGELDVAHSFVGIRKHLFSEKGRCTHSYNCCDYKKILFYDLLKLIKVDKNVI